MEESKKNRHFQGKQALEHVVEARQKGKIASAEFHGTEFPGHYNAACDAAKETIFFLLALSILFEVWQIEAPFFLLIVLAAGTVIWKGARSALLGWARLERLHRLIEEERWEIEHHRFQEKEELKALYAAKGFSGKLLDEVIDVLMADDNRLLQIMLEEELGLDLESQEHPLKQAAGACLGSLAAGSLFILSKLYFPHLGEFLFSLLLVGLVSIWSARHEKNHAIRSLLWNLSAMTLSMGVIYFGAKWILSILP